ncbi:hypothetical protein GC105_03535 [Alkalibaculum sp. M08DMB]|uniref:Tetratricopeptide repeat protein n=1 Tax=Alkalibaculum sporogenes TaxID=2655001 RepID=A0A6A7K695_9FIRM|nr:hypothetical protein [Alkalibaculum sporogenes]MPW24861.1 hypothetical protein [Alkalibaculum sporogenes]
MKIFDRRFLKYQLAALKHNKYKNKILYPNIFLFAVAMFYRDNIPLLLLFIGVIVSLIGFGIYRFNNETSMSEDDFERILEKKYKEYESASSRKKPDEAVILQKIAFAAELNKISNDDAINDIQELITQKPEIKKFANNIIICLYANKFKDKSKIPGEYLDYLDRNVKSEVNVNLLSDCIKTCIIIGDYNKVLSIVNKALEELKKVKKIRKPAYNAIYRTMLVSLPFYQGEAYKSMGNKKKAKESYEQSLKNCKSKNFRYFILDSIENIIS